ncbi:cytochrome P450 [Penicillium viridicatum]|nr:cytochrome P450 [Penicillium viridicatum]
MEIIQLWALLSFILASIAIRTLYRLYFHPLSKFPGPKLAASTHLYEFYFDVVSNGIFLWEIQKMHEKHGPIVRINPRELHINDSHYYDHIYASGGKKRNKDRNFVGLFSAPLSMITTIDHDHHRFRSGILSNFFSKKSVLNMTPLIQEKLAILMERFEQASQEGVALDLTAAFCTLTGDIVTHYTYGQSFNSLHEEDFKNNIRGGILELENPMVQALSSPAIPADERTLYRLQEEGMILLSGSTESPANALSVAAFYLADEISILERLRAELQPVMCNGNFVLSAELEQLPYLTGVVNEALRLSFGLISRPPRIASDEVLVYREYDIPAGTPVGMSSYFMSMDPTIFPNPESFIPDRWVLAAERGENLTRFIATFGKGSRACIGINLGYAELYFTIAAMAHRFKFELHETTQENIRAVRDRGLPFSKGGHWRVKAKVSKLAN